VTRDRAYLDWLRTQPCIITGRMGDDHESVVPAHIGTAGKGLKSPDSQALPVLASYHSLGHQKGEITMFRTHAPDWLIREALRAYAEKMYQEWKEIE